MMRSEVEAALVAVAALPRSAASFRELGDALMPTMRVLGQIQKMVETALAAGAAEIASQSAREFGMKGLAAREGARSPEKLVQRLTGISSRDAGTLVRAGAVMHELDALETPPAPPVDGMPTPPLFEATQPWLTPIGALLREGLISPAAADTIRYGLGIPTSTVTVAALSGQAEKLAALVREARAREAEVGSDDGAGLTLTLTVEELGRLDRGARLQIDDVAVAAASADRAARQALKVWKQHDGMIRIEGLLSPEHGGAEVLAVFEQAMSPRRGGPRFVDPEAIDWAKKLETDPRSNDRIMADVLVDLLRLGSRVAPTELVGHRQPAVRVLVTRQELEAKQGVGRIEGHREPVPIGVVEQTICNVGTVQVMVDAVSGSVLDVGREQRLFTQKQRVAIASRDGGCAIPDCDCDPSKCEFHHIEEWAAEGGPTNVDNGTSGKSALTPS